MFARLYRHYDNNKYKIRFSLSPYLTPERHKNDNANNHSNINSTQQQQLQQHTKNMFHLIKAICFVVFVFFLRVCDLFCIAVERAQGDYLAQHCALWTPSSRMNRQMTHQNGLLQMKLKSKPILRTKWIFLEKFYWIRLCEMDGTGFGDDCIKYKIWD